MQLFSADTAMWKKIWKLNFSLWKHEKKSRKVAYLSKNSVISEIFHLLPNSPNARIHAPKLYIELGEKPF